MKKQIFGTTCAVLGLLFASGATIVNGIIAIILLCVAALCLSEKAQAMAKSNMKIMRQNRNYRKAA